MEVGLFEIVYFVFFKNIINVDFLDNDVVSDNVFLVVMLFCFVFIW